MHNPNLSFCLSVGSHVHARTNRNSVSIRDAQRPYDGRAYVCVYSQPKSDRNTPRSGKSERTFYIDASDR
jgi:hypothetical protein